MHKSHTVPLLHCYLHHHHRHHHRHPLSQHQKGQQQQHPHPPRTFFLSPLRALEVSSRGAGAGNLVWIYAN
ncbi:unnamed protein product [Sphagnum jensenii]|uniref:Uncharacterized protein n=1 Tax=Sphagnum jensenii TaxID=128206 RepID=A0ABP1BQA5_9BRYO